MERSPFTNAQLRALPLSAYAYTSPTTAWCIRRDGATVAEATLTEAQLLALAEEMANEHEWRASSRRGDAPRDYDGE